MKVRLYKDKWYLTINNATWIVARIHLAQAVQIALWRDIIN